MVIKKLQSLFPTDEASITFAFCDWQRSDKSEHVNLARSLLRMILEQPTAWPVTMRKVHEDTKQPRSDFSLDEVFDLLKDTMRLRTRKFVIIDALDELAQDARNALMAKLFELQRRAGLNIFVTSRDIAQIGETFSNTPRLKIKATREDIEQYISTHIATLPDFVSRNTGLQNEIKESVVKAAGERFLLADLHIRSLKTKSSPKSLRKALQNLSSGPNSTKKAFENAMTLITSQPEEVSSIALKTLMILTTARRALTTHELCHALAVDLENLDEEFDEENAPSIDYVLSSCSGLVVIEDETRPARKTGEEGLTAAPVEGVERPSGSRLVHLAHKSIRDYLSSHSSGWLSHPEASMALICRKITEACETSGTEEGYHFLDYVRSHGKSHPIKCVTKESDRSIKPNIEVQDAPKASFSLAARQDGDQEVVRQLALDLEGMREDLLLWACRDNRTNVVETLLADNLASYQKPLTFDRMAEAGVQPDCGYAWCYDFESCLDIYPRIENCSKSKKCSVDVCTKKALDNKIINGAVVAAAYGGRINIVETLMEHGASIASRDRLGYTALGAAASTGQSDMLGWLLGLDCMKFKLLLDSQPRFAHKRKSRVYQDTTLIEAYDRLLFEFGVEGRADDDGTLQPPVLSEETRPQESSPTAPHIQVEKRVGRIIVTPLVAAASNGHEKCVNLILQWAQHHSRGKLDTEWKASCMNAMLRAMDARHITIVRALLPFTDVHYPARGFNNYTLLHFASLQGNLESLRLLLADEAADLSLVDDRGRTALALAARTGADDLITELWARGPARVDPLAALEALIAGYDNTFSLLCRFFLDCNPGGLFKADSTGYSCFDRIVFNCIREMAGLQDGRHTEIESINVFEWNPIPPNTTKSIPPIYRLGLERLAAKLLEHDNCPILGEADDSDGEHRFGIQSLLFALTSASDELLQALLQLYPASVCESTSKGGIILMAAFSRGSKESIDIVLDTLRLQDSTTVINSTTVYGQSALTAAIANGRDEHAEQFQSFLTLSELNLRLVFQQDANTRDCPLMSSALLAYEHAILPPSAFKSTQGKQNSTTCETLYNNCWQLLREVYYRLDRHDLSKLYLKLSEDCSQRRRHGLIHLLCQLPQPGCLELLLQSCPELRSQLHVPDNEGMTALMHAAKTWRHHETFKFILKQPGVDIGHRDNQGRTALSHVAENLGQFSDGGVATTLVYDHAQGLLARDNRGWSPLHYAIANGNVWKGSPYHQLLAFPNLPMEWTDEKGSTPLHLAIKGGSPLAIKLLLQNSCSSSWLNAADVDGMVPLAYFFSVCKTSKFMYNYRMRLPYSGPARFALDINDTLKHHNAAHEALRMMLSRPDIRPDIPDNEGRTPLWHALDCLREEHRAFISGSGTQDGEQFQKFLTASIEALCAHHDVNPDKCPTRGRQTPADLAAEVVQMCDQEKAGGSSESSSEDGDSVTSGPEYAGGDKAWVKAMMERLSAAVRQDTGVVVVKKKKKRRRQRRKKRALTTKAEEEVSDDDEDGGGDL